MLLCIEACNEGDPCVLAGNDETKGMEESLTRVPEDEAGPAELTP